MSRNHFEVIIVGAGIAGASLAYFLADGGLADVLVVEREELPGHHATGRSAAVLVELDPIPALQRLKVLSAGFLGEPPPGFVDHPLLERSGVLVCLRGPLWDGLRAAAADFERMGVCLRLLSPDETAARVPVLVPERFDGAVLLPEDGRIDVHGLLTAYLGHARRAGVTVRLATEVLGVLVERGRCTGIATTAGSFRARWVVDAAGAWAGAIGRMAGALPIPLVPHRRTIVTFAAPDAVAVRHWPFVGCEVDRLYFAPESGGLLLSPMDEQPMEPADVRAEELVVAEALHRLGTVAPRLVPRAIRRAWAGLRTFSPDRVPVVGPDPRLPGFFWLAGQGGCGIETSPIVGQVAADLLLGGATERLDTSLLSPSRFAAA